MKYFLKVRVPYEAKNFVEKFFVIRRFETHKIQTLSGIRRPRQLVRSLLFDREIL